MGFFARLGKVFKTETTVVDNFDFRLHYKATAITLVALSIFVACKQYFGQPIQCTTKDVISTSLLNSFCLSDSTYSVLDGFEKKVGEEVPYPSVDKYTPGERRVYHTYYQWVSFVLFLQAILFYIPRHIWKVMEGGRTKKLIKGLSSKDLFEDTKSAKRKQLIQFMFYNRNNDSTFFFISYVIAEMLNFANVVGQIFLMNSFFGGELASKILEFTVGNQPNRYNPMIKVFPRLTKCTFNMYGSSGDVQRHDAMCTLPINVVYEKIYIFLRFWFIILAVLSGLTLIYRAAIVVLPKFRLLAIRVRGVLSQQEYLEAFRRSNIGDWIILDLLYKNLDPLDFSRIMDDFARERKGRVLELLPA